jgi:hypothetical protein
VVLTGASRHVAMVDASGFRLAAAGPSRGVRMGWGSKPKGSGVYHLFCFSLVAYFPAALLSKRTTVDMGSHVY